jgi:hypothetical protein
MAGFQVATEVSEGYHVRPSLCSSSSVALVFSVPYKRRSVMFPGDRSLFQVARPRVRCALFPVVGTRTAGNGRVKANTTSSDFPNARKYKPCSPLPLHGIGRRAGASLEWRPYRDVVSSR